MNECTLVTAFYDFRFKKHTNENYDIWIRNFLENTDSYMVIYTDSDETANYLLQYRKQFLQKTKIIVEPLDKLYCYQPTYQEYWLKDYRRDHENTYHNPYLYIIWNEKSMFMFKTYVLNPFKTDFYAWVDIGMVREPKYIELLKTFPSAKRLATLNKKKAYVLSIEPFTETELKESVPSESFRHKNRIGGGMIICSKIILDRWVQEYYNMLQKFVEHDLFAGKDQSIMANLYLQFKDDLLELVVPKKEDFTIMDNKWFYMLYFLSDKYIT